MAKATMRVSGDAGQVETPSQNMTRDANAMCYETDKRGRRIGVVKPSALTRYRLLKILGPESAKNEPLLGHAMLAFLVREINGEPVQVPNSERQIEAMIDRLDDDGLNAIGKCLKDQFGVGDDDGIDEVELTKN